MNEKLEEEISSSKYVETVNMLAETLPNDQQFGAAVRAFIVNRNKLIKQYQDERRSKQG